MKLIKKMEPLSTDKCSIDTKSMKYREKSQYFQKTGDPVFPSIYFHLTKRLPILLFNHRISKASVSYDFPDIHFINSKIFEKNPVLYSPPSRLPPIRF